MATSRLAWSATGVFALAGVIFAIFEVQEWKMWPWAAVLLLICFFSGLVVLVGIALYEVAKLISVWRRPRRKKRLIAPGVIESADLGWHEECNMLWHCTLEQEWGLISIPSRLSVRADGPYCKDCPRVMLEYGPNPALPTTLLMSSQPSSRPLKPDDTSGGSFEGVYCPQCKSTVSFIGRVMDCQAEVIRKIEQQLWVEA